MHRGTTIRFILFLLILCGAAGGYLLYTNRHLEIENNSASEPSEQKTAQTATPAPAHYVATIALPAPAKSGGMSVEQAIAQRRSRRLYDTKPLTLQQLSQILWAGQGITDTKTGKRTAPSAYEVYPYTLYVVVRDVTGLKPGLYAYIPEKHALGDMGVPEAPTLLKPSGAQPGALQAQAVVLFAASIGKATPKLKDGAESSTYLEGGHIGENMYLEAESMKLSMVVMAGFDSAKVLSTFKLDPAYTIVYEAPIGTRSSKPETE